MTMPASVTSTAMMVPNIITTTMMTPTGIRRWRSREARGDQAAGKKRNRDKVEHGCLHSSIRTIIGKTAQRSFYSRQIFQVVDWNHSCCLTVTFAFSLAGVVMYRLPLLATTPHASEGDDAPITDA